MRVKPLNLDMSTAKQSYAVFNYAVKQKYIINEDIVAESFKSWKEKGWRVFYDKKNFEFIVTDKNEMATGLMMGGSYKELQEWS